MTDRKHLVVWITAGWVWVILLTWAIMYGHPMIAMLAVGLPLVMMFTVTYFNDPTRPGNRKGQCPSCGQPI